MHKGAGLQEFVAPAVQVTVKGPPAYPASQLYVTASLIACFVPLQLLVVPSVQVKPLVSGCSVVGASSQAAVGKGVHHCAREQ